MKLIVSVLVLSVGILGIQSVPFVRNFAADPPTCPPTGDFFAPHEDCTKYYVCDNGDLIVNDCPNNLYWNPTEEYCDFQHNVPECVGGTRPPGGTNPPTTKPTATTAKTTEAEQPTTTEEPATEPEVTTQRPTTVTTPKPTSSEKPPQTTESEHITTEEPEEPTTRDPNNPCTEEGVYTLPVENECSAYIQCFNGLAIPQTCAPGLQFDPELGKCNKEELVNCTVASTVAPTTSEPITTQSPICAQDGYYNTPFDKEYCSPLYIFCADHVPVLQECAEGLLFDREQLTCLRSEDVNCTERPTTSPPVQTTSAPVVECTEDGVYNIPVAGSNCTEYILCVNYNAIPQTCAPGTLFSEEVGKCVREEDYTCPIHGATTQAPIFSSTSGTNSTSTATTMKPTTSSTTTSAPGTNGPSTENMFPCPETGFHYLPHYESCAKFYMCSDGQFRGVYSCGSSYWFNAELQGCVPPEESDCTLEPLPITTFSF